VVSENSDIQQNNESEQSVQRIDFIDALRGFAILMMLQGHCVGLVLQNRYRSTEYFAYQLWDQLRAISAPSFFFAAGLIFTYLLLKEQRKNPGSNARISKGLCRVGWLLCWGMSFSFTYTT